MSNNSGRDPGRSPEARIRRRRQAKERMARYRFNNPRVIAVQERIRRLVSNGELTRPQVCVLCHTACSPLAWVDPMTLTVQWLCRQCWGELIYDSDPRMRTG